MDKEQYDLEVLKLNFSFLKFLLGTFLIGIVTLIINSQLKSKEIELAKIKEENTHLTTFVSDVVQVDPERRRDVALYFSIVTGEEEAKDRWYEYHELAQKLVENSTKNKIKIAKLRREIRSILENKFLDSEQIKLLDMKTIELEELEIISNAERSSFNTSKTFSPDNSTFLLNQFLRPDGVVNDENKQILRLWMNGNGIDTSITFFIYSEKYREARNKAVDELIIVK